jgi:glucose-6-phosphate dehydrogenase assembly protein OpcA
MPRTPTLGAFSVWTAKTLRKTPIRRLIHKAWYLPHLAPLTPIRGEAAGAEEAEAEVGVEAGAEATTRKENGIVFSTRKTMTTAQIIAQIRKDSKQSLRRKERKRRERVP